MTAGDKAVWGNVTRLQVFFLLPLLVTSSFLLLGICVGVHACMSLLEFFKEKRGTLKWDAFSLTIINHQRIT